jgi:hypothetical protein
MARERRKKINPPVRLRLCRKPNVLARFLAMVEENEDGCWIWSGHTDPNGYGQFKVGGRAVWAHRAAYALFRRTIAAGREIDHHRRKCQPGCVNPWHLKERSPLANATDGGRRAHEALPI